MDYKAVLADLRAHLPPQAGGGGVAVRRGSLRWLETQMQARGAGGAAVRNIIYRNIGTVADREILRAILIELAAEAGRVLPETPPVSSSPPLPAELELLGRSKKRAYRQFLAGVRAGRAPRLIVTGRAGAGKTVLLDSLDAALREAGLPVRRLFLSGEAGDLLGLEATPGTAYAQLAAAQVEAARRQRPASGTLLVRVTDDLSFAGGPPRSADGSVISPARWAAEHFLQAAPPGLAVLLALEKVFADDLGLPQTETITLHPPTPAEARSYLMASLGIARAEADSLVAETGRHLDRLSLLVRLRGGQTDAGVPELLTDPDIRRLAGATAALDLSSVHSAVLSWPPELLRAALGTEFRQSPPHARALLAGSDALGWTPTPALRAAWNGVEAKDLTGALRRLAGLTSDAGRPVRLAALVALKDWAALAAHIHAQPDDARWLPPLWPSIRHAAVGETRDDLAGAVVRHHAGRGDYHDSGLRDALFTLLEATRPPVRAWARVKLAESSMEAGNMAAAAGQLAHPEVSALLSSALPVRDAWAVTACADALLVQAALTRWAGDLEAATRAVMDPRAAVGGPRAGLWRGLIAKDAGRWDEALGALASVLPSSPLLSARARYQEGDLRLRLGQPAAALAALRDAVIRLEMAGAGEEERARVLARSATALRRLGLLQEAHTTLNRALALLPPDPRRHADGVPRARLLSEGIPLLLALGRPNDALAASAQALALLTGRSARPAEVQYRQRRTHYRVALAYLTRGLGQSYLQPLLGPLRDHPDLQQARALLDGLIGEAATASDRDTSDRDTSDRDTSDRDSILLFDMHLSRALAEPHPATALDCVARALALAAHPYEEAQARAMRAEVQWRAGRPAEALADLNRAHALLRRVQPGLDDLPDPGLQAQLLTLEAAMTIGDGLQMVRWLRAALADPALAPFRVGVWRALGRVLEAGGDAWPLLQSLHGPRAEALAHLRPGDALWLLEVGEGESLSGPFSP